MTLPLLEMPAFRFVHEFTVPEAAIDALGRTDNVEYVRRVQDVAGTYWLATG